MPTTFKALDPATGTEGPEFVDSTAADVSAAVAAATAAARDPRLRDPARRVVLLRTTAARLRDRADELVAVCEGETGLPAVPRLRGELERTCRQLEAFADVVEEGSFVDAIIDPPDPDAKPIPRPDLRRMLHPIGPVAVFGASNFPLAFSTAGGDTASALAAGCPVLVKGHPAHPATGALVAEELLAAVADAGLPEGDLRPPARSGDRRRRGAGRRAGRQGRRLHGLRRAAAGRSWTAPPRARRRSPSTRRWGASTRW